MTEKPRILLVDDEPFILSMMRSFLDENKFTIKTAGCGNDAIAMIRNEPFDCVVSDVRMPNGTGFQLLGWIREMNPTKPTLIFVTGYSDIPAEELLAKGADTYISKPFNVEEFAAEIALMTKPLSERLLRAPTTSQQVHHIKFQAASFESLTRAGNQAKFGRGGMFVAIPTDNMKVSQAVSFEIDIADGSRFRGTGKILWIRRTGSLNPLNAGVGIIFETLEPKSAERFIQFVEDRAPVEVIPRDC